MQISVRGSSRKVADQVRSYAVEKVEHVSRLFEGLSTAVIDFHEERNPRVPDKESVEVTLATASGTLIRAGAHAPDLYAAVDVVVDRLETQVRKMKGKLIGRSHARDHPRSGPSRSPAADGHGLEADGDADDDTGGGPQIVRTKRFDIKPMTAEDAALQMDLLGHTFYLFSNSESGEPNVVYRRRDGDVGLIEPLR